MVVNVLLNSYPIAEEYTFYPWQLGLLDEIMKAVNFTRNTGPNVACVHHLVKIINLGSRAGHTHFARVAALKNFLQELKFLHLEQVVFSSLAHVLDPYAMNPRASSLKTDLTDIRGLQLRLLLLI